ncbi:MAG TPA: hypothetical protein PLS34_02635 [Gammaproteobacteria bacterium]|nr:hypothetical protein [Gammaproteobacteria bacterium]
MAEEAQAEREAGQANAGGAELARLRDRTDEIELIISGLTTFALFTLPGWLFERIAEHYTHLSVTWLIGGTMMLVVLTGLCYGLGTCFLVHLLARAYWVGLIGLRTAFPRGIDWQRTPGIGPVTRQRYRERLPDLQTAIERSDRLASSLFAVISVIALGIFWIGALVAVTGTVGGLVGARFGATNVGIEIAFFTLIGLAAGTPVLLWLLDAGLAARWPRLQQAEWFRTLLGGLARVNGWLVPQRLVLPVQLTLQSNTRPILFIMLFTLAIISIVMIGQLSYGRATRFTLSNEFHYLGDAQLGGVAFRSSYYEDMRDGRDRLRAWPTIPSFEQRGSAIRLFLPYRPLRDNLVLERLCPGEDAALGAGCLRRLWSVSLNGVAIDLGGFLAGERLDLGMRGLVGAVPLEHLAPGIQVLTVVWNPDADEHDAPLDDRYSAARLGYEIPFLFAPDYERELESPGARRQPEGDPGQ